MKIERLLRVHRAARTIHLVINVPEPPAPSTVVSKAPKPSVRARLGAFLKVAGPVTVSVAAIIIAILSLQAQDTANLQQSLAGASAEGSTALYSAEQVSFQQGPSPQLPTSLVIKNRGATPIYSVTFQVEAFIVVGRESNAMKAFTLWLGDVPACSSGSVNIAPGVIGVMQNIVGLKTFRAEASTLKVNVDSMSFADVTGLGWQDSAIGGLHQTGDISQEVLLPGTTPMDYIRATYKTAAGCI